MKKRKMLFPVLCCALLLSACVQGTREEDADKQGSTTGVQIEEKDGKEFFVFQDVEGNTYRSELQEKAPRNTYDFANLHTDEETGFKSYKDEKTGTVSRMGIDVSEFQGEDIDWKQVRESGIEFVIVRLGYRAYGETGELVLDDMFDQNVQGALDAGLDVGVYFFSQAITPGEAVEEAEFVLKHIRGYEIDGPVVYDTEEIKGDTARTDGNTRQEFTNYCKVFCDTIEQVLALDPENVTVHALALKRSSRITQSGEINRAHADAALADRMMAYAEKRLTEHGLAPYYLYRQSRMAGNLENTGWAKPGFVCAYNIFTMDETETVLACGAGGVCKLKDPYSEDLTRIFNFKYSYEYISRYGEILKRKEGIGRQYEQFRKRIR